MKNFMQFVSFLFHPLLMPTQLFGLLYWRLPEIFSPITKESVGYLVLAVFITTFAIPAMSIGTLRITSTIQSFTLRDRNERIVPFLFIFCFYAITTYLFMVKINVNTTIAVMMIATSLLILLLTIITLRHKISIHSAGVSGTIGFLAALTIQLGNDVLILPLACAVALAGLVMTSRLYLNAHSIAEIGSGALAGFVLCFGGTLLFG